jgi:hypothetical protein
MSIFSMVTVAEVFHGHQYLGYGLRMVQQQLLNAPGNAAQKSLGVEIAADQIVRFQRIAVDPRKLLTTVRFWKSVMKVAADKGIRIVPLVNNSAIQMNERSDKYLESLIKQLRTKGKLKGVKGAISISMLRPFLTKSEFQELVVVKGRAIREVDKQLKQNILREQPTLSLVGAIHGDVLTGVAQVIPFPGSEITPELAKDIEIARGFRRDCEKVKAAIENRQRAATRQASDAKKKKREKEKKKRKKR